MPDKLEQQAQRAVELARNAGAGDVWVTALQNRDVEFEYRDGKLEKVKDTTAQNLALRLYADGRYSTHSTTDLSPARLPAFIDEAVAITRALEPDEYRQITPSELYRDRPDQELDLVDAKVATLDREQRIAWCEALNESAHDNPRVVSATAGIYDGSSRSVSVSSNGFTGATESTYCWFGAEVTLKDQGEKRAADWFYAGGSHVEDLPDAAGVGAEALSRALSRLDAQKGPSAKTVMVVDSRAAGSLIGRLLRPANARSVQQGQSFWADQIDRKPFSDALTIVDDPLIRRGLASRHYDDEGISARVMPIVENGRIRNIYVDTYYGLKGDMPPTTGSMSNLRVGTSDLSLAELLSDVGEGVYVTSWLGGNSDSTTGDFSLGLRGHMIENGKVGRPVGEMNVTGNLKDLFARLDMVGNDIYPYSSTLSPSLVFSGVDFSGA